MQRNILISLTLLIVQVVTVSAYYDLDEPKIVKDSATAVLASVTCADVKTETASEVTCFLSFPDSVPNFFYETDTAKSQIIIKLLNTRLGDIIVVDKIDTINIGPITTLKSWEEIQNKNEGYEALNPEWYYVSLVAITCKPMIKSQQHLIVTTMENAISVSFPWPEEQKKRNKYYFYEKKPRRNGLIISIIGIGVVGLSAGGYLAYQRYFAEPDAPDELHPVLPEHPSDPGLFRWYNNKGKR